MPSSLILVQSGIIETRNTGVPDAGHDLLRIHERKRVLLPRLSQGLPLPIQRRIAEGIHPTAPTTCWTAHSEAQ